MILIIFPSYSISVWFSSIFVQPRLFSLPFLVESLTKVRFNDDDIKFLLHLKWWDLELPWIKENYKLFHDISLLKKKLNEKEG